MRIADRVRRRVLSRRESRPLNVLRVALEMAMTGFMFTMLIIMMLVEGATPHSHFPADMAKARHVVAMPGAKREDAIRIILTRDGAVYFGHTEIRVADIADQIREKLQSGSERRVYLMVDRRTKNWDVENVVDAIRGSGVWNVGLLAEQDQTSAAQP